MLIIHINILLPDTVASFVAFHQFSGHDLHFGGYAKLEGYLRLKKLAMQYSSSRGAVEHMHSCPWVVGEGCFVANLL